MISRNVCEIDAPVYELGHPVSTSTIVFKRFFDNLGPSFFGFDVRTFCEIVSQGLKRLDICTPEPALVASSVRNGENVHVGYSGAFWPTLEGGPVKIDFVQERFVVLIEKHTS